jgi:hypothetical protein
MMPTMMLPRRSNLALLRSLWIVLSLLAGATVMLLAWLLPPFGGPTPAMAGAVAGLVILLPGLLFPYEIALVYRGWNWMTRRFSRFAVRYVTGVCFGSVGLALSLGSSPARFEAAPSGTSMWKARGTQSAEAYASQYHRLLPAGGPRWTGPVRSWMRDAGPRFAWALLPFLVLIRALHTGDEKRDGPPAHVYTLY